MGAGASVDAVALEPILNKILAGDSLSAEERAAAEHVGEAHRLVVDQHFQLRAVGRPLAPDVAAAWLYVMPRRGEEKAMQRALAENS